MKKSVKLSIFARLIRKKGAWSSSSSWRGIFTLTASIFFPQILTAGINPGLSLPDLSYDWGQWQFSTRAEYFNTTANYSASGNESIDLPSGYSYRLIQGHLGFRWVAIPKASISVSTGLASAESQDFRDTRRNTNITEVNIGADYEFYARKNWDLISEVVLSNPLHRVDSGSDDVLLHEGSMNLELNLAGRYFFPASTLYGKGGFTYRDENRASLLTFLAGLAFHSGQWSFAGESEGFMTAIRDSRDTGTAAASARSQVYAKNGNSLRFYSVDPSVIAVNFWAQKDFGYDWLLRGGVRQTLTGSAYSAGTTVFIDLNWSPDTLTNRGMKNPRSNPNKSNGQSQDAGNPSEFREDTLDGVDQKLFEETPQFTEKPAPAPKPVPSPSRPKPPKKPYPKAQTPTKSKADLKKELDQTEFQIELKTEKKKRKKK